MNNKSMKDLFISEYLSKVLGFAYLKTNDRANAEDLAQDISVEILKVIDSGRKIEDFNAFIWKLSNNTYCKWLRRSKQYPVAYLTGLEPSPGSVDEYLLQKEERAAVKRELAFLSQLYREVLIMHYFEGKNCNEIARLKDTSTGTVKWWLYDARNHIKEGMKKMREYGEKSFKPGKLVLSCQGNPGADYEPMSLVKRKSSQNILLAAYKKPMTLEELSLELGISMPYIEDEVACLVENQLMVEISKGSYQTDFVILQDGNTDITVEIKNAVFPEFYTRLMGFINKNRDFLEGKECNTAKFPWSRLLWVYIHMISDMLTMKYKAETIKIAFGPERPKGGNWIAIGFDRSELPVRKYEIEEYHGWDGPVHRITEDEHAQNFFHHYSGLDSSVFFNIPYGVFKLCNSIVKGEISIENMDENQKALFSHAIEKGLFIRDDNGFRQNYCYIPYQAYYRLKQMVSEFYPQVYPLINKAYSIVLDEHAKDIPKHLDWQKHNFLSNYLNCFVTISLYEAYKDGILSEPDERYKHLLSLFSWD